MKYFKLLFDTYLALTSNLNTILFNGYLIVLHIMI